MEASQVVSAPTIEHLLALAEENDFGGIIDTLGSLGISSDDMGEELFTFAKRAIEEQRYSAAISILNFLVSSLEDQSEAPPLLTLLADLYIEEENVVKARECLGQLPLTFENVRKIFNTFLPSKDLDGLLAVRDNILPRLTDFTYVTEMHCLVHACFSEIANDPVVKGVAVNQYSKNLEYLQKIDPAVIGKLPSWVGVIAEDNYLDSVNVLGIAHKIYARSGDIWQRICLRGDNSRLTRAKLLNKGNAIAVRCANLSQLVELRKALAVEDPEYFKLQLYIIVSPRDLRDLMMVEDLAPLMDCDFVIRFIDSLNLVDDFQQALLHEKKIVPTLLVHISPEDDRYSREVLNPVVSKIRNDLQLGIENYKRQLAEIYPPDFWKTIPEKIREKKLRILFKTSRYTTSMQYSTRDLAEGFKELGCEVFVELEEEGEPCLIRSDVCMKNIIDFRPDVTFAINHLRYEYSWVPATLPHIIWVQDAMDNVFGVTDPELLGKWSFFYSSAVLFNKMFAQNPAYDGREFHLLNFPLNEKIYYPLECKKKYEVCYVAHQNFTDECLVAYGDRPDAELSKEELKHRNFIRFTDTLSWDELTYFFVNSLCDIKRYGEELLKRFYAFDGQSFGPFGLKELKYYSQTLLLAVFRCRILKPLVENNIPLVLFGRGWEKHPWLNEFAKGAVENGEELNRVVNESKINLNISPGISFHNKVPEVLGASAFMLTRDIGELDAMPIDNMFDRDKEVVIFRNEKDLVDKVNYFLEHDEERELVASRAYKKMINHTYTKEARRIIHHLETDIIKAMG